MNETKLYKNLESSLRKENVDLQERLTKLNGEF